MGSQDLFRKEIIKLIATHCGQSVAELYSDFCTHQSKDNILKCVRELLADIIGSEEAEKVLVDFYKKLQ